jgi:hypothetical protein
VRKLEFFDTKFILIFVSGAVIVNVWPKSIVAISSDSLERTPVLPPFKPMKRKSYEAWIHQYGWSLQKGSIDWVLFDAEGKTQVLQIKENHPGPKEITANSVKKTRKALQKAGLE